ncbi:MAG: ATP-binding protein [Anaerolineales bacterium]|jgi:signal transduction histidine kinase
MRRSITLKLVLAFLLVAVTGLALASGITYWLTVVQFKQLVLNQSLDRFVSDAGLYYQINGSWKGVLNYFNLRDAAPSPGSPGPQTSAPQPGPGGGQAPSPTFNFMLADAGGQVLIPAGTYQVGESVPSAKLAKGTPVDVNGKQVGTVLVIGSTPPLGTLETQYLNRTNLALLYAALGAALVALVLGIILARTLTHPVRDLTAAIHAMARGDLKQSVAITSGDELGELAAAFNQMSSDLDRLSRSRQQMTADIAHDLRTPLTVIGGYVESMHDGVLKPTPERFDIIHAEVQHLERLVEDLRTLSQADAGELSLNREAVLPSVLLERTVRSYGALAVEKKIELEIQSEPGLPPLSLDPDRMAQVFGNLITNALRYTPEGGRIRLTAARAEKTLVLAVQDNGRGIPAEDLPHIFDRFYRADPARSQAGESGLGLAIAKSIVEAHGGKISAESQVGQGTTIKISFPLP